MLIEFKFRNFTSYKDEAQLLMTPVKSFKEHNESHVIYTRKGLNLLKAAAIYGSNGGGKTITLNLVLKRRVHQVFLKLHLL